MSNPGVRPIEPKGSAGVEMSEQMGTTGRRCALYATLRPGKINLSSPLLILFRLNTITAQTSIIHTKQDSTSKMANHHETSARLHPSFPR